jgi:hypothetical protein
MAKSCDDKTLKMVGLNLMAWLYGGHYSKPIDA